MNIFRLNAGSISLLSMHTMVKLILLFAAVLRIAANYCFHGFQLIDSCHGDSSIKGRNFTEVIILS